MDTSSIREEKNKRPWILEYNDEKIAEGQLNSFSQSIKNDYLFRNSFDKRTIDLYSYWRGVAKEKKYVFASSFRFEEIDDLLRKNVYSIDDKVNDFNNDKVRLPIKEVPVFTLKYDDFSTILEGSLRSHG